MRTIIVGSGKLAQELLTTLSSERVSELIPWGDKGHTNGKSIVVHAGSGRELKDVIEFCEKTNSPLVELATGSEMETAQLTFPAVLCANTNILMLRFMSMLAKSGHLFRGYPITLTESHQAEKTSVPGTAVSIAQSLEMDVSEIRSVRSPELQKEVLHIPDEHLNRHAYHRIVIEDTGCSLAMETRVYGATAYADGVCRIISAIRSNTLENRLYTINEFVEYGWI
jgi:dihydrodipicolinate reductase